MTKPTLVFIPGLWEGPTAFSKVVDILDSEHNYPIKVIPLTSTGTSPPNAKTFPDDVHAIRDAVEKLANEGKELVFIMHSAGAFTGSQAIKDLSLAQRKERGETGGVRKLVYLCGALLPQDSDHPQPPFFETMGDRMYCRSPLSTLFNDLPPAEAEKHAKELSWQPSTYNDSIYVSYCAWKDIPSVYLCCTQDRIIPLEFQHQIAAMVGAETESCDAGHMVTLSQPERVVEVVRKAIGEVRGGECGA